MNRNTRLGVAGITFFAATALFYSAGNTYEQGACMEILRGEGIESVYDALKVVPADTASAHERIDMLTALAKASIAKILAVPAQERTFANTLEPYDEACGLIRFAAEVMEVYQGVGADLATRSEPFARIHKVHNDLFMDVALYRAIKEYKEHGLSKESLSPEDAYFLEETLADFVRSGFDLPAEQFEKVRKLQQEEAALTAEFSDRADSDNSFIAVDEADLDGVDPAFIAKQERDTNGKVILRANWPTRAAVPGYCKNAKVRRDLATAYARRAYDDETRGNVATLEKLLAKRLELAQALGYKDYASYQFTGYMIKSADNARKFVDDMYARARSKADEEFAEITRDLPEGVELLDGKIQPGDGAYIRTHYEKSFNYDGREVAKYFPVTKTLKGIFTIYEKFMGLSFVHHESLPGAWHESVQAIEVKTKDATKTLGYILLDLHPRPYKYGHACHAHVVPSLKKKDGTQSVSVGVMLANFAQPTDSDPGLLTHSDVTTFFHEFGHAIHGVLGRTSRIAFSGTNVKLDYVELPSQILEEWMWDRELLKMVSGHYQTGEKLSDDTIDTMFKLRQSGAGSMVVGQMSLANIALQCHDARPTKDTDAIIKSIYDEYFPHVIQDPRHHFQASFGHLGGYKAGYYGYMFSRAYADDVFDTIEKHGLMDDKIGARFVKWILSPGGSQDPNGMLKEFLGREPSLDAFCRRRGLSK